MQNVKGAKYHETLTDIESFLTLSFVIIYLFIYLFFSCVNHLLIKEHGLEDFIATVISSSRNCPVWLLAPDSPHSVSNTRLRGSIGGFSSSVLNHVVTRVCSSELEF